MSSINLIQLLSELGSKRRIFHSEDDFKFCLAWQIQEHFKNKNWNVLLEYPVMADNKLIYIDIVVKTPEGLLPVELKYKTATYSFCYNNELDDDRIELKNQSAQDNGRYFFYRDVRRIEQLLGMRAKFGPVGYAVLLTNDPAYWNTPPAGWESRNDGHFRMHEGCEPISGKRFWTNKGAYIPPGAGWEALEFHGVHPVQWRNYMHDNQAPYGGLFRYVLIELCAAQYIL